MPYNHPVGFYVNNWFKTLFRMKSLFFKKRSLFPARQKPLPPLALCLLMDMLGCASYMLPFFGEFFDLVWAPVSAIIYWRMFGGVKGLFGGSLNFLEELLPGLDIIPTFTITWFMQYHKRNKETVVVQSFR
jgi:hypothetical protein